jgi:hypothetical protein
MVYPIQPVTITASATMNRDTHAFNTVNLSAAAGLTVTLPASTGKGDEYEFFVLTTVTSNNYVIAVANATDVMQGGVALSTDIGGTNMLASSTSDTITMNGSTKGGLIGSWVRLKDVSAGFWKVEGYMVCTGTEADPFSAAVS